MKRRISDSSSNQCDGARFIVRTLKQATIGVETAWGEVDVFAALFGLFHFPTTGEVGGNDGDCKSFQ